MPHYHMAGLEPPETPIEQAREAYEASDRFTTDAIDWLSDHADQFVEFAAGHYQYSAEFNADAIAWLSKHADQFPELAGDHYQYSPEFTTMVEDICDGVVEL